MSLTTVVVALGSNLGDRHGHLAWAAERLDQLLTDVRISPIVESAPEGVPDVQPPYLNAVVVGRTDAGPRRLLEALLGLEQARGRVRRGTASARTLDLDLILYGDEVRDEDGLVVPHPRFRDRLFVLEPLAALAPELRDPVSGRTVAALLVARRARA